MNTDHNESSKRGEGRQLLSLALSLLLVVGPILAYLYNLRKYDLEELKINQTSQRISEQFIRLSALPANKEVLQLIRETELQRSILNEDQIQLQQYKDRQLFITVTLFVLALTPLLFEYLRPVPPELNSLQAGLEQQLDASDNRIPTATPNESGASDSGRPPMALSHENLAAGVPGSREPRVAILFGDVQLRFQNEIGELRKRSNIHLVVGVVVTGISVALLLYITTHTHPELPTISTVLSFFIPRLFTIALLETFAYFFLRLYKANRDQITFYQNERSTITALEIAWLLSDWPKMSETSGAVIRQIAATDRNARYTALQETTETQTASEMLAQIVASLAKAKEKGD